MDYDKHFTVMNYRDESSLKQINCEDFVPLFNQQYPDQPWTAVQVCCLRWAIKHTMSCDLQFWPAWVLTREWALAQYLVHRPCPYSQLLNSSIQLYM